MPTSEKTPDNRKAGAPMATGGRHKTPSGAGKPANKKDKPGGTASDSKIHPKT